MLFDISYDAVFVTVALRGEKPGLLARLFQKRHAADLANLPPNDRTLLLAIADLRALADEHSAELDIGSGHIRMSHSLAARLPGKTATTLGLPEIVDLTLRTDVEGVLGTRSFRLRHEWTKNGQRQLPQRTGSILETSDGLRRLPLWLMEAVEVAENFRPGSDEGSRGW